MVAPVRVRADPRQVRRVRRRYQRLVDVTTNLEPTFRDVAHPWLLAHMRRRFLTQGAHGGLPWAPLFQEPKYLGFKRAVGASEQVFRWKPGEMERLYPSLTDPRDPWHIFRATADSFYFGTAHPHAQRLQAGGIGPFDEPYPPRRLFAWTTQQRRELFGLIREDLLERARQRV